MDGGNRIGYGVPLERTHDFCAVHGTLIGHAYSIRVVVRSFEMYSAGRWTRLRNISAVRVA